jgi:hypothetical protein
VWVSTRVRLGLWIPLALQCFRREISVDESQSVLYNESSVAFREIYMLAWDCYDPGRRVLRFESKATMHGQKWWSFSELTLVFRGRGGAYVLNFLNLISYWVTIIPSPLRYWARLNNSSKLLSRDIIFDSCDSIVTICGSSTVVYHVLLTIVVFPTSTFRNERSSIILQNLH